MEALQTRIKCSGSVIHALGDLGDKRAAKPLQMFLNDRDRLMRQWYLEKDVVEALGKIGSNDSVYFLAGLAGKGIGEIRLSAIHALSHIKCPEAEKILINLMNAKFVHDDNFRKAAIEGLGEMKAETAVLELIKTIRDPNEVRECLSPAFEALGKIGDKQAIPAIVEVLESPFYEEYHEKALCALGKLGGTGVLPFLEKMQDHKNWRIRRTAKLEMEKIYKNNGNQGT